MRTRYVVAVAAVTLLAACGGTNKSTGSTGSASVTPSAAGSSTTVDVNKAYWYAGFKVTVLSAKVVKPPKPSPGYSPERMKLVIDANFQNLGPDNYQPSYNHNWAIQSGTNSYLEHAFPDEKVPEVPGLQTTQGVIAFYIDDKFNLDNAVLLVGNAQYNQPEVPLGKSGKLRSLEPQQVAVSGTLTVPNAFTLAVSGGELSYDDPKRHEEQKAGSVLLTVHYAITGNRDSTCCFGSENAIIKLPDGTAEQSVDASGYAIPAKGLTTPDQFIKWAFKGADGQYDLIVKGRYGPNNEEVQADLPFSLTLGLSQAPSGTPPAGGAYQGPSAAPEATPSGH